MQTPIAIRTSIPNKDAVIAAQRAAGLRRRFVFTRLVPALVIAYVASWCAYVAAPSAALPTTCVPLVEECALPEMNARFAARASCFGAAAIATATLVFALRSRRRLLDDALALGIDPATLSTRIQEPAPEPFYLQMRTAS